LKCSNSNFTLNCLKRRIVKEFKAEKRKARGKERSRNAKKEWIS
jgi:hypothetical protein